MPINIEELLGKEAGYYLNHVSKTIPKESLHLPGPDFVDRVFIPTDRKPAVLRSLQQIFDHGRLAGTGYLSILPVDQGIEHSAGASFAPNPIYFDPENIVKLAIEGGCNAVASTFGVLGSVSRKYAHKIPFIVKINHNEFLSYPNTYDQIMFGDIDMAFELGAVAVGCDDLLRFGGVKAANSGSERGVQVRPRARDGHDPLVLYPQQRVQDEGEGLPRLRRPHRAGKPSRRDHRSRHHQAETPREQRRVHGVELRQDAQESVQRTDARIIRST